LSSDDLIGSGSSSVHLSEGNVSSDSGSSFVLSGDSEISLGLVSEGSGSLIKEELSISSLSSVGELGNEVLSSLLLGRHVD